MNWDAIGAIGELVGAMAVVVSLIYVAVQIRQNTKEARILRSQNLVYANADANSTIASNADLAEIVRKGMLDFGALDEAEQFRFSTMFFSFFIKYDFAYHQYRAGRLDDQFWDRMNYEIPVFMTLSGAHAWWERDKARLSKDFVAYVDSLLENFETTETVPAVGARPQSRDT